MNTKLKFSRDAYLNQECTHRQYYAQFVSAAVRSRVLHGIGKAYLLASKDREHLNDIPLIRWDSLSPRGDRVFSIREADGNLYWSLSNVVCIAKEAAKQLIEEWEAEGK